MDYLMTILTFVVLIYLISGYNYLDVRRKLKHTPQLLYRKKNGFQLLPTLKDFPQEVDKSVDWVRIKTICKLHTNNPDKVEIITRNEQLNALYLLQAEYMDDNVVNVYWMDQGTVLYMPLDYYVEYKEQELEQLSEQYLRRCYEDL